MVAFSVRQKILEVLGCDWINAVIHFVGQLILTINKPEEEKEPKIKDTKIPPLCCHANPISSISMAACSLIHCIVSQVMFALFLILMILSIQFINNNPAKIPGVDFNFHWLWGWIVIAAFIGSVVQFVSAVFGICVGLYGIPCFVCKCPGNFLVLWMCTAVYYIIAGISFVAFTITGQLCLWFAVLVLFFTFCMGFPIAIIPLAIWFIECSIFIIPFLFPCTIALIGLFLPITDCFLLRGAYWTFVTVRRCCHNCGVTMDRKKFELREERRKLKEQQEELRSAKQEHKNPSGSNSSRVKDFLDDYKDEEDDDNNAQGRPFEVIEHPYDQPEEPEPQHQPVSEPVISSSMEGPDSQPSPVPVPDQVSGHPFSFSASNSQQPETTTDTKINIVLNQPQPQQAMMMMQPGVMQTGMIQPQPPYQGGGAPMVMVPMQTPEGIIQYVLVPQTSQAMPAPQVQPTNQQFVQPPQPQLQPQPQPQLQPQPQPQLQPQAQFQLQPQPPMMMMMSQEVQPSMTQIQPVLENQVEEEEEGQDEQETERKEQVNAEDDMNMLSPVSYSLGSQPVPPEFKEEEKEEEKKKRISSDEEKDPANNVMSIIHSNTEGPGKEEEEEHSSNESSSSSDDGADDLGVMIDMGNLEGEV